MNAKLAKKLRKFAEIKGLPYGMVKRAWKRSPKEEQEKTLPSIKEFIYEKTKNNK